MATITFNKNGGTGGTDSIDSTSSLTQISVPHKNGYNFIGYVDTVTDTMYYEGGGKLDTSLSTSSINNLTAQYIPMPVYIDTNFNGISANYGYYGQSNISYIDGTTTIVAPGSITDLTNTKWYFYDTLEITWFDTDPSISTKTFAIDFDCDGTFIPPPSPHHSLIFGKSSMSLAYDGEPGPAYQQGTWGSQSFRIITITGGVDAVNEDFIEWMRNNAVLYSSVTIGSDNLNIIYNGRFTDSYTPPTYGKCHYEDIYVSIDQWKNTDCLCVGLLYNSGTFEDTGEGPIDCGIELLDGFGKNLSDIIYQAFPNNNHPYWGVVFGSRCKSSITTKYVRIRIKLILDENAELTTEEYSIRPIVYFVPDARYRMTSAVSVHARNDMPIGLIDITNNDINVIGASEDEYSYPLRYTQSTHIEINSYDTKFKADRYKVTYDSGNLTTLNDNLTHLQQMLASEGLNTDLYNNSFKLIQNWKLNNNAWYQSQPHLKAGGVWRDVIVPTIKEHINRLVFTNAYVWAQVSQVLTHKQLGGYTYNELYNLDIPYNELTDTYKHYQGYTHDELSNSKHESIGELEE